MGRLGREPVCQETTNPAAAQKGPVHPTRREPAPALPLRRKRTSVPPDNETVSLQTPRFCGVFFFFFYLSSGVLKQTPSPPQQRFPPPVQTTTRGSDTAVRQPRMLSTGGEVGASGLTQGFNFHFGTLPAKFSPAPRQLSKFNLLARAVHTPARHFDLGKGTQRGRRKWLTTREPPSQLGPADAITMEITGFKSANAVVPPPPLTASKVLPQKREMGKGGGRLPPVKPAAWLDLTRRAGRN